MGVCRYECVSCGVVEQMGLWVLCWVGVLVGGMWVVVWVLFGILMGRCGLGSGVGGVLGWRCV